MKVVIAIISILAGVLVGNYTGYVKDTKETMCNANLLRLERMDENYLIVKGKQHNDVVFIQEMMIAKMIMEMSRFWIN